MLQTWDSVTLFLLLLQLGGPACRTGFAHRVGDTPTGPQEHALPKTTSAEKPADRRRYRPATLPGGGQLEVAEFFLGQVIAVDFRDDPAVEQDDHPVADVTEFGVIG